MIFPLGDYLDWYLLIPGCQENTHVVAISDSNPKTCGEVVLANSPKLLKTTLDVPYTFLNVSIGIKEPRVSFGTTRSDCGRAHSLLMAHNSSGATGVTCKPFCEVPHPCQLADVTAEGHDTLLSYQFSCQCTHPSCNDIFILLQPEFHRDVVEICDVNVRASSTTGSVSSSVPGSNSGSGPVSGSAYVSHSLSRSRSRSSSRINSRYRNRRRTTGTPLARTPTPMETWIFFIE